MTNDLFKTNVVRAGKTTARDAASDTATEDTVAGDASCCAGHAGSAGAKSGTAIDPVCGMSVTVATAKHTAEHDGRTYYFCHPGCRTKFLATPEVYLKGEKPSPPPVVEGAIYTCPMDPEIRQIGPGTCPICGMALEPEIVTATTGPNPELIDMTRRFWIGLALTLPVFVLEMGGHLFGLHGMISLQNVNWTGLLLATPVVLWAGWPFFERGWASIQTRNLNMFTLIAIGTGIAWLYSVAGTVAPGLFPDAVRGADGAVPVYFEAAAVITVLVLLGQVLELRAREQTSSAVRGLLDLSPKMARRLDTAGTDTDVPIGAIQVGDLLRVRPGERVPVDGIIRDGEATLDQAAVTGESIPMAKGPGDSVIGGTMNVSGAFVMRAEKVGTNTMLARIVQMVAGAQRSRAPIQRLADKVAGWFVPAVLAAAAAAFAAWWTFGPEPRLTFAVIAAVSVLIIACPCALGLATPMSIMVGVGRGAETGVLIRSAEALERMANVDTLLIDKTGTLTAGQPELVSVEALGAFDEHTLLALAASIEANSEHPLGDAIVRAAKSRGIEIAEARDFQSLHGKGARGRASGHDIVIGNQRLFREAGLAADLLEPAAAKARAEGATALFMAVDGKPAGVLALADTVKPGAAGAVAALRADGIRVIMVTGDTAATAEAVARAVGISDVEADVLPEDKMKVVARWRADGHVVAMAGDGINDAPALAAADVGIAMGTGTDIAMESAGITLLGGDLSGLLKARTLSRATVRNIRQNLFFAFFYNAAGIPLAGGLFYPVFGWLLSPAVAAAAMSLSSVSVIANALRLRRLPLTGLDRPAAL